MKLDIQLFASGSKTFTASGYLQGKLTWTSTGNEANNTSSVTAKLYAKRTSGYTTGKSWNGYITIDGTKSSFSSLSSSTTIRQDWVLMKTYTKTVEHNNDGTKSITISGSVSGPSGTSLEGVTSKGSLTATLDVLHKSPDNIQYSISETNTKLINAGISNTTFVENLSKKSFNITANLYDGTTASNYTVYNRITPYSSTTLPVIIDFSSKQLSKDLDDTTKVPIRVKVTDSKGSAGFSSDTYDLYSLIPYTKINLIESLTKVKRNGQLSGKVYLNVEGKYYNGVVGNVNQQQYKPVVKYKFWETGKSKPQSYNYTVPSGNVTISSGTFRITNYEIGSATETNTNWFNPEKTYKVKLFVQDNFTTYTSETKTIPLGEATWTEYKDRVDFKKLTIKGKEVNLDAVSVNLTGLPSGSDYHCIYFPMLGMCFCRIYLTGSAYATGSRHTIATVPEDYRPGNRTSLATDGLQDYTGVLKASVNSDGQIGLVTTVAKESADDIYISGWWLVND